MMERIISDERIAHINRTAYRAGRCASDVYTQVGADGEEIVRCRDCFYWRDEDFCANPQWQAIRSSSGLVECPCTFPESFCSFGERRGA